MMRWFRARVMDLFQCKAMEPEGTRLDLEDDYAFFGVCQRYRPHLGRHYYSTRPEDWPERWKARIQ